MYSPHTFGKSVLILSTPGYFDFSQFCSTTHVETKLCTKYFLKIPILDKILTHFVHVAVLLLQVEVELT